VALSVPENLVALDQYELFLLSSVVPCFAGWPLGVTVAVQLTSHLNTCMCFVLRSACAVLLQDGRWT
jgi:hypothetical protein